MEEIEKIIEVIHYETIGIIPYNFADDETFLAFHQKNKKEIEKDEV